MFRPRKNGRASFEVVAGERRFRAAGIAKLETIPCIVREFTNIEVIEIQAIENLQRDDLHPLEEAEGYAALVKKAGYDVAEIAKRIGKSHKYVYDRLKLLQLIPAVREVFLGGEISTGHAILIARLSTADQELCLGKESAYGASGGLFQFDSGDVDPRLELGDEIRRKAVSIRELETWINGHVRFRPEDVDLPNLFPETAATLATATEQELKVVKITHDYQLKPETRQSGERTYARTSWKRADGQPDTDSWSRKSKPSKECEHSVLGVVIAGPGRGEAFPVCIAKKKCEVHWAEEQKRAAEKKKGGTDGSTAVNWQEEQRKRDEQWKRDKAERDRWEKAVPALLDAIAAKLKETPGLKVVDIVLDDCRPHGMKKVAKQMGAIETMEDALRVAAFFVIAGQIRNTWSAQHEVPKLFKRLGLNARSIVNEAAPKPKPEKAKKKTATKGKKASA